MWFDIYGHTPKVITSKGNFTQLQLTHHRVAHYLGFSIAAAPPVPTVITTGVPAEQEAMTNEEKRALVAKFQANLEKLQADLAGA